jgi:hypothetical protein
MTAGSGTFATALEGAATSAGAVTRVRSLCIERLDEMLSGGKREEKLQVARWWRVRERM